MDILTLVVIGIVALAFLAVFLLGGSKNTVFEQKKRESLSRIETLQAQIDSGAINPELAVIQSDSIIDTILKAKTNVEGSMGDRLKASSKYFKKDVYHRLWEGHKTRNRLVHENSKIAGQEAKNIIKSYMEAIRSL